MPDISVIVPIYKVENYLRKCVDSILPQTFGDYELFLVDDGSPDGCPVVCDEYAMADDRILVIHKPNGGLSDARNAALELVRGEYITFVDSDDWIAPDALETMREALLRTDSDMAIGNMYSVDEQGKQQSMAGNVSEETVLEGKDVWTTILQPCAPKKIYRSSIWKTLRFPVGRLYEDAFTYHHVLAQVDRIVKTGRETYYYLIREGSIMHMEYDIRFTDIIDAIEDRIAVMEEAGVQELAERDRLFIYSQSAVALSHLDRYNEKEYVRRQEVWRTYKKHFPKIMRSRAASVKEKILFLLLRVAPNIHSRFFGRKMPLNLA